MSENIVDARGLICPLPVLKARKVLLSLAPGQELTVLSTDDKSSREFALFCEESGHSLISVQEEPAGVVRILIRAFSARARE